MKTEKTLLEHYQAWLALVIAKKARLATFDCPHCGKTLKTPKPSPSYGRPYDSLCTCPFCDGMFFKVVYSDGHVVLNKGDGKEEAA